MIEGEQYPYHQENTGRKYRFEFVSTGTQGTIPKVAQFTYLYEDVYNFGFGDWDSSKQMIDDERLSHNGDAEKVLNTLGKIIQTFTTIEWSASIFVKGNTEAKHRWYRMSINKNLAEIENHFFLWGRVEDRWEPYQKGKNYSAFLANRLNGGFSF